MGKNEEKSTSPVGFKDVNDSRIMLDMPLLNYYSRLSRSSFCLFYSK